MMRPLFLAWCLCVLTQCASREEPMQPVEFLTRAGCVQTKIMNVRLDAAIEATGKVIDYSVVDVETLAADDVRRGYPTPTILAGGVDIFGMPAPTPPFPDPT